MNDYQGWKIPEKLHIFAHNYKKWYAYPQAMIASSDKKEAISTAKCWASGKYYEKDITDNDYVEYIIDNKDIELSIIDSANGSSQGGKLSFWNCLIEKDDMHVIVGIGSDLLLEIIKNCTFINGKCQEKLIMARKSHQWGALHENMDIYKEAIRDMEIQDKIKKSKKTTVWTQGYNYYSKMTDDVYLYDLYQWYDYTTENLFWDPQSKVIVRMKEKPYKKRVTIPKWAIKKETKLSELIKNKTDFSCYYYPQKMPSKIKGDKIIDIDLSISEIQTVLEEHQKKEKQIIIDRIKNGEIFNLPYIIHTFLVSANPNIVPEIPKEILDILPQSQKNKLKIIQEEGNNG